MINLLWMSGTLLFVINYLCSFVFTEENTRGINIMKGENNIYNKNTPVNRYKYL